MVVDFDSLVLAPAMDTFARPVMIDTVSSAPLEAAFTATGVFGNRHVEVATEEGYLSTLSPVLGVRLSTLARVPDQGDRVTIDGAVYTIDDVQPDGEGHADLILKRMP